MSANPWLTREQILAADDRIVETVDVPEWGGLVRVRGLTGAERDAYEATIITTRGSDFKMNLANARARLVARAVIDADGKRLFSDDDVVALGQKSAAALERIYEVASQLAGLSKTDVEEMVKNSVNGRNGDSGSASP